MEYRSLGAAGVRVSPLCLGTMMFGAWGNTDHDDCIRIIHRALDSGVNFIDTANLYSQGESEEIVGKALKGRREEAVLATKVYFPMGEGPNQRGLSRKAIQEQVEHSLRRLDTDVIDLYQIHRPDPETPWEETMAALDALVRDGKVRYIGCSTNHHEVGGQARYAAWQIVETLWLCAENGWESWVSLQPPYSILRRTMELEHFPMCLEHGIGNLVWSPLEGGWLTGKYRRGGNLPETPRAQNWVKDLEDPRFERRLDAVDSLLGWSEEKGAPLAELALGWTLRHPAVTSTIIGPRTMEQLESCIAALDHEITDEDAARIDSIVAPGESVL
ncbi:MAG: aldo/keto reductase [Acidobacteriota bacterium]